jgi:hypothetical protein
MGMIANSTPARAAAGQPPRPMSHGRGWPWRAAPALWTASAPPHHYVASSFCRGCWWLVRCDTNSPGDWGIQSCRLSLLQWIHKDLISLLWLAVAPASNPRVTNGRPNQCADDVCAKGRKLWRRCANSRSGVHFQKTCASTWPPGQHWNVWT